MCAVPLGEKIAVRRPRAKEGGREEEEKRSGIAVRRTDRLYSNENHTLPWSPAGVRSSRSIVATMCFDDPEVPASGARRSSWTHTCCVQGKMRNCSMDLLVFMGWQLINMLCLEQIIADFKYHCLS